MDEIRQLLAAWFYVINWEEVVRQYAEAKQ